MLYKIQPQGPHKRLGCVSLHVQASCALPQRNADSTAERLMHLLYGCTSWQPL